MAADPKPGKYDNYDPQCGTYDSAYSGNLNDIGDGGDYKKQDDQVNSTRAEFAKDKPSKVP